MRPTISDRTNIPPARRLEEVSIPAGQHLLPTLVISASLAGPLLHLAGLESGGIHLFGNSSTGKTTLQKLAASAWGNGGLVYSWRATSNGLEGIANRTSDVALILDELGQLDTKDAATSFYMLASGVGKTRMTRTAAVQDIKTWRTFVLSSGEMTVEAKITQLRGAKAYTGATLRLLNVAADRGLGFGVFDSPGPTGDARDLVNAFSTAAASAHGVAGPEFVKELISRAAEGEAIQNAIGHFVQCNVEHDSSGQVERAAKRFGLIATAGELATEFGVTGWQPGVATAAAVAAFKRWVEARGGDGKEPAEDRAAIRQVTSIIVNYGESRFDEVDERGFPVEPPVDGEGRPAPGPRPALVRYGWRKGEGDDRIWMIDDAIWESVFCQGFDPIQVSKALARHGLLKHAKGRLTYAERFQGKRDKRFHVITGKIVASDYDRTPEDAPDDDDGLAEDAPDEDDDGPERPKPRNRRDY
jgi:putative DNA primase/helicase